MNRSASLDVQRYYDGNTRSLLALGHGRAEGALHRAVWGPGIPDRSAALHYVEDEIARRLIRLDAGRDLHVLDLGAGVGASLCYLARTLPIRGTGITSSPVQARLASARIEAEGFSSRVRCLESDYNDLPEGLELADAAFAIESFVHGATPERFFAECARSVRPGGLLVICDDFLSDAAHRTSRPAARLVDRFRYGWHVNTLFTEAELEAQAKSAGFRRLECLDLTIHLELDRPRDRAIAALMATFGWLPLRGNYWRMLYGGDALQKCLKRGIIRYLLTVFEREPQTSEVQC